MNQLGSSPSCTGCAAFPISIIHLSRVGAGHGKTIQLPWILPYSLQEPFSTHTYPVLFVGLDSLSKPLKGIATGERRTGQECAGYWMSRGDDKGSWVDVGVRASLYCQPKLILIWELNKDQQSLNQRTKNQGKEKGINNRVLVGADSVGLVSV